MEARLGRDCIRHCWSLGHDFRLESPRRRKASRPAVACFRAASGSCSECNPKWLEGNKGRGSMKTFTSLALPALLPRMPPHAAACRPLGEATGLEPGPSAAGISRARLGAVALRPSRVQCGSIACSVSQRLEALQRFLGRGAPNALQAEKCPSVPGLGCLHGLRKAASGQMRLSSAQRHGTLGLQAAMDDSFVIGWS